MNVRSSPADLETTNRLRRNVARTARLPAWLTAEAAVSAVMCALTERLTAGEAHELLLAIPAPIRPMFARCVLHREGLPTDRMDRAELVARVADHLDVTPAHAELVCSAVFDAIRSELPPRIVASITNQLPRALQDLWLGPPLSAPDVDVTIPTDETRLAFEIDLERRAKLPPGVTASSAFTAVMCTLARRLSGGETRHVLLGLPHDVRPLLARCAAHRQEEAAVFDREELLRAIGEHLALDRPTTEHVVNEVLRAVKRVLPQSVIGEITAQLPPDMRELWASA